MSKKDTFVPSITLEQVQKIKSRIAEAIKEYGKTVIDKEAYAKATEGLKYKSSNGQKVYLVVPTRSQKKKIQNEYLRGIQIEFNKNHKLHYQLKFAGFNKSKLWIPALLGGLATTGGATGAAVYFALNGGGGTVVDEDITIQVNLDGGKIGGQEYSELTVAPGTLLRELPTPVKDGFDFIGWENTTTNEPLPPDTPVDENMSLKAIYEATVDVRTAMGGSTTLTAPFGEGGTDDNVWKPYLNGEAQSTIGCRYDFVGPAPESISITAGKVSWLPELTSGDHTFKIRITDAQGKTYDSETITITISDVWELKPYKEIETGIYGEPGDELGHYVQLLKNGETMDLGHETWQYTPSVVEESTYDVRLAEGGGGFYLEWNQQAGAKTYLSVGDNTLHFQAKENVEPYTTVAECIVHLVISEAPVGEPIIITGDSVVNATDPNVTFKAATYPGGVDKTADVIWSAAWKDGSEHPGLPTFDNTPTGVKGKMTTFADTNGVVTVSAKDSSGAVLATFDTTVQPPYIDSDGIWGKFGTGTSAKWGKFDATTLSGSSPISYTLIGSATPETPIARANFVNDLYIGNNVIMIEDDFLANCTGYTGTITFEDSTAHPSKCTWICDNFMLGCSKFNSELILPDSVNFIGMSFMHSCTLFNNGNVAGDTEKNEFVLPASLRTIGQDFFEFNSAFNNNITITSNIENIGNTFMYGCTSMSTGTTPGRIIIAEGVDADVFECSSVTPISFAEPNPQFQVLTHSITIVCSQDVETILSSNDHFPDSSSDPEAAFPITNGFWRDIVYVRS
ncbi:MAG: hypothetical protein ACOQNY_01520 [Mycoplasmoidaceae bacterium]